MRIIFSRLLLQWLVFSLITWRLAAADHEDSPKIEELVRAGKSTLSKFVSTPSSWTIKYRLQTGGVFETKVVRNGDQQSWTFSEVVNRRSQTISRLIQKDGIWHVIEKNRAAKYRPYEAELRIPGGYLFFSLSDLRYVVDAATFKTAIFERREGNVCSYRIPLSPESHRAMEQVISEFDGMAAKEPSFLERPEVADTIRFARDQLANGSPLRVDEKSGMVVEFTMRNLLVAVEDFRWLKDVPDTTFALPKNARWDDRSQILSEADLEDCVMVGRDPIFTLDASKPAIDGYLLNLKTGLLRRLPYQGLATMPGCFLKDRKEVVVTGFDASGDVGLLKLNLLTGANTPVDYGQFKGTMMLMAELSPDSRKIATMQMLGAGKLLDLQIRVINLQTGSAQLLGKPTNIGAPFSWLPEGDGLILKRFERQEGLNAIEPRILCRIGLDGKLSDLRPGDWPVVLRKTRRILYEDGGADLWHTCNLDGSDPKLFADGLKGYGMPAVSPDEARVVFVRYEKGKLPQLTLFDLGKEEGKPAVRADGFTGTPVWR